MKLRVALIVLLSALCYLNASVAYTYVQVHHYGTAVSRVVVGFSEKTVPTINKNTGSLEIRLKDDDNGSAAPVDFSAGGLVSGIEQNGGSLQVTAREQFRYEQLGMGNRLALDIFVADPNKAQRLEIADFYRDKGKLASADKAYNALHIDYREDAEILYHWAELLAKRGSSRATDKLSMIPSSSSYYRSAQVLLAKLHGDEEPLPPPPVTVEEKMVKEDENMPVDSIIQTPVPEQAATPPPVKNSLWGYIPVIAVDTVLLAIAIYLIFIAVKLGKRKVTPHQDAVKPEASGLDTGTLCRMVSKLLADGWTMREISKELKISQKEVENLVQLCHHGGHDEPDA